MTVVMMGQMSLELRQFDYKRKMQLNASDAHI